MENKIIVIGGGPAGIEAALAAARTGAKVLLINDGPIGGRAAWHSLLPSKAWLEAAARLNIASRSSAAGLKEKRTRPPTEDILRQIQEVKQRWHNFMRKELLQAGVEIVQGTASFVDSHHVRIQNGAGDGEDVLAGDTFIIAAGSVPMFPPALKPDGQLVIAPRFVSHLQYLPERMIVVGAGATGCENAYLFNCLGVDVTWIVDHLGILPNMHLDLGIALGLFLARQGVHIIQGQMVQRLERGDGVTAVLMDGARYEADMAFVAIGRKSDLERLNLEAAGLIADNVPIAVNKYGQVNSSHIYLVGDAAGRPMVANKGIAQGWAAGRHAAGIDVPGYNEQAVIHAVYTSPEVAQAGNLTMEEGVQKVRIPFEASLKSHLLDDELGFFEIYFGEKDRFLRGAMAIGPHASSSLSAIALGLEMQTTVEDLARVFAAHPTIDELAFTAARKALQKIPAN